MATSTFGSHQLICLLTALICSATSWRAGAETFNLKTPVIRGTTDDGAGADGNQDDEDDDNPIIKLPTLPAKPGQGGNTQKPPVMRPTGQDMKPLDKSAYPSESCALVDNRPHQDLIAAIQNLTKVVVITPQCKDNIEMTKMNATAQALMTAAQSLQNQWTNSAGLGTDPKALGQFQSDVTVLVQGIEAIATSVENNSLVNGACGKQMTSNADVLVALSDLVTTAAPYALMGASMGPHAAITIPFVLGLTGAGSVAKIIKTMHDQNTLDTTKAENRMAVLQNVCEFSKISQRVRFLKLAQSGQLDQVTQELSLMKKSTDQVMRSQFSDRAFAINAIRDGEVKSMAAINSTLRQDQRDYAEASTLIGDLNSPQADATMACSTMRDLVANEDADSFVNRAVLNFKALIAKQVNTNLQQKTLLGTEARLKTQLKTKMNDESAQGLTDCANTTRSYMRTMGLLLQETQSTLNALYASMDRQLRKDSEYSAFLTKQINLQEDQKTMTKVVNVLKQLNSDNSVIDKVEMDYQMTELRRALFGKRPDGFLNSLGDLFYSSNGEAPALAWLNFVDEQWNLNTTAFDTEMTSLIVDSFALTESGRRFAYPLKTWGSGVEKDPRKKALNTNHMAATEKDRYLKDVDTAVKLANLTPALAPKDSGNQQTVCHRLENAWFAWAAALDQLRAQDFFCENIRSFFDTTTDPALVQRCDGQVDLSGKVLKTSGIQDRQALMVQKGFKNQALVVSGKMKELSCPVPDMSVMK